VLRRSVVPGAISNTSQIADLASASTIVSGEQVSIRQFHPVIQQGVLASIAGNTRAMTVPGDPNQLLSGTVKDGDRVDVVMDINYTVRAPGSAASQGGVSALASRIILRNLLVLRAPTSTAGGGIGSGGTGSSITLALTDTQAQKLLLAMKNGQWWLVLRPVARPSDSPETVETIGSLISDGLGPKAIQQLTNGYGPGSISNGG
jgi:Flp pilus assembly protein CpaB